jgi:hypothetical protein
MKKEEAYKAIEALKKFVEGGKLSIEEKMLISELAANVDPERVNYGLGDNYGDDEE